MLQKRPVYRGISNPLFGAEKHAAVGAKSKKAHPIGEFQIGRKSESSKVKEIFG